MRENFNPVLEQGGVDLVLCGHSHSYERTYFIDGHYGNSGTWNPGIHQIDGGSGKISPYTKDYGPHNGTVYVVCGSSSTLSNVSSRNVMHTSQEEFASIRITVDGNAMLVQEMKDPNGAIGDYFNIVHTVSLPPDQATNPSPVDTAIDVSNVNTDLSWIEGALAASHDIYFGTDPTPDDDGGNSELVGNQAGSTYDPGTLDPNTIYY